MYYKYESSNRIMASVTHQTVLVWAAPPLAVIQQGAGSLGETQTPHGCMPCPEAAHFVR